MEQAKLNTLRQMLPRAKGFRKWMEELYHDDPDNLQYWLSNEEGLLDHLEDFLGEQHQIDVRPDGLAQFWVLDKPTRHIIGNLPVMLYHHTASGLDDKIRREGLSVRKSQPANPHQNSRAGVYLTTEFSGPAVTGYSDRAVHKFGGNYRTWGVKTTIPELRRDPDDQDISSGRHQFVLPHVPPENLIDIDAERRQMSRQGRPRRYSIYDPAESLAFADAARSAPDWGHFGIWSDYMEEGGYPALAETMRHTAQAGGNHQGDFHSPGYEHEGWTFNHHALPGGRGGYITISHPVTTTPEDVGKLRSVGFRPKRPVRRNWWMYAPGDTTHKLAERLRAEGVKEYDGQNKLIERPEQHSRQSNRFGLVPPLKRRYAQPVSNDMGEAMGGVMSHNQGSLNLIAKDIASSLRLLPGKGTDAVHFSPMGTRPSIVVEAHAPRPEKALYAASWLGLMTRQPGQVVFVPGGGEDLLHHLHFRQGSGKQIAAALRSAGIPDAVMIPSAGGMRVQVFDREARLGAAVKQMANRMGAHLKSEQGSGTFVGGPEEAQSREAYRRVIRGYEAKLMESMPKQETPQEQPHQYARPRRYAEAEGGPSLFEWEPGPTHFVVQSGRRTARVIGDDETRHIAKKMAIKALVTGRPTFYATHGGSVAGSYGYPASTDLLAVVGLPSGHAIVRRDQNPARGVTQTTAGRILGGLSTDPTRPAYHGGHIFHGGTSDATKQKAKADVAAWAEHLVGNGDYYLKVSQNPAGINSDPLLPEFFAKRLSPEIFADALESDGHPDAEPIRHIAPYGYDPFEIAARIARQRQPRSTQYARKGMDRLIDWFFRNSMGLKRHEAPQMPADKRPAFLDMLRRKGVKVEETEIDPASLRPSQSEWSPEALKRVKGSTTPILVASNNYVIDGHHRWIDHRLRKKKVTAVKVGLPARQLIAEAAAFGEKHDIERKRASRRTYQ